MSSNVSRKIVGGADQILALALKKEEAAYRFYDGVAKDLKVEFLREMVEKLREEEAKHVQMIRKRIAQLEMGKG